MKIRWVILLILLLSPVILYGQGRLAGDGEDDETLQQFLELTRESDLHSSRTETPKRRASENKFFGDARTLPDMELYANPYPEISPYNWEVPDGWWPQTDGTYGYNHPDQAHDPLDPFGWYLIGCWISCFPAIQYCDSSDVECTITTSQFIGEIDVSGPGTILALSEGSDEFRLLFNEGTESGERMEICVSTLPTHWQEKGGACCTTVIYQCEEDECLADDYVAPSFGSSLTGEVDPGGTTNIQVSGGHGPFTWTLSIAPGEADTTGWSFDESTSDGDNVLNLAAGECDASHRAKVYVTVTDSCGISATKAARTSDGRWQGCSLCQRPFCSSLGVIDYYSDLGFKIEADCFSNCSNNCFNVCNTTCDGVTIQFGKGYDFFNPACCVGAACVGDNVIKCIKSSQMRRWICD